MEQRQVTIIAAAVVIAGLLIAGAVLMTHHSAPAATTSQPQTQVDAASKAFTVYLTTTYDDYYYTDCLNNSYADDTFSLREPGNGLSSGAVLAVPDLSTASADGCTTTLTFTISPSIGFFDIVDETQGSTWGPTSFQQVEASGFVFNGTY